ncbi:hypothetical protein ILUMI_05231 [Ignelater luminosus]|uniref:Uncharacterized protein n=1 Tax=Ignelater luminosus TaxID=2038154 RepID=A0A8K0D7G9_IGNLU|nr:hypothetical protein ILUMI_05231 [Ignelater luminosus]
MKLFLYVTTIFTITFFKNVLSSYNQPDLSVEFLCIGEVDMDLEELNKYVNSYNTPEDHVEMGKFLVCLWEGKHVMDKDGNIDSGKLKAFLQAHFEKINPEEVNNISPDTVTEKCHGVQTNIKTQTAIRLNNCIVKTVKVP